MQTRTLLVRVATLASLAALVAYLASLPAAAREYGQFGPFDYYDVVNTPKRAYALVESAHLGPKTEAFLRQGNWCAYWGDLDYTLRAFPNHPRALTLMSEFLQYHRACGEQGARRSSGKKDPLALAEEIERGSWQARTAEFYFETAIEYRPQYAETRLLYGRHLMRRGKRREAIRLYHEAESLQPSSAEVHYELGLAYVALEEFDKAKTHATKAYKLGQPEPDLRDQLIKAGHWAPP